MDGEGDASQRQRDEEPAQGIAIRNQRQDRPLRLGEGLLRELEAGCADGGDARRARALEGAALGEDLGDLRRLDRERRGARRKPFAPFAGGPEIDMDEARPGIEAEAG